MKPYDLSTNATKGTFMKSGKCHWVNKVHIFGKSVKKSMCSLAKHTAYSDLDSLTFTDDTDTINEQMIVCMQSQTDTWGQYRSYIQHHMTQYFYCILTVCLSVWSVGVCPWLLDLNLNWFSFTLCICSLGIVQM